MEDTSLRSRAALELLGRGGQQLSQALGAGDFDKFLAFVDEFGAKASPKAAKSAATFQDSISLLNVSVGGLKQSFVESLGLIDMFSRAMNVAMAVAAGVKAVLEEFQSDIVSGGDRLGDLGLKVLRFFTVALAGSSDASAGIKGLVNNILIASQALIHKILTPMIKIIDVMISMINLQDQAIQKSGSIAKSIVKTVNPGSKALQITQRNESMIFKPVADRGLQEELKEFRDILGDLQKFTDINTVEGFEVIQTAMSGAESALEAFNDLMSQNRKNVKGFGDDLKDGSKDVEKLADSIDLVAERMRIFDRVFATIGIPEFFRPQKIREIIKEVDLLGQSFLHMLSSDQQKSTDQFFSHLHGGVVDLARFFHTKITKTGLAFNVLITDLISKLGKEGQSFLESTPLQQMLTQFAVTFNNGVNKLLEINKKITFGFTKGLAKTKEGSKEFAANVGSSLIAKAGKIGVGIGAALGVLQLAASLGQRGSTKGEIIRSVEDEARARAKAIQLGLQVLPDILYKTLPRILAIFADALIFGIAKAFAERINQILTFFKSIFTREGRQERRSDRQDRRTSGLDEFLRRLGVVGDIAFEGMRSGGRIPSARSGMFTGSNAGLHLLHKNEFVVPESGRRPQSVDRVMSGSSAVNIVINAQVVERNAVDELVRQIERRFQTFGQSTSPLFGN